MTEHEKEDRTLVAPMSAIEFAHLGGGEVAYIRQMDAAQAMELFPALSGLPEGIDLYAVLAADGTPLSFTDSRNSAIANARQNDLEPVSVH